MEADLAPVHTREKDDLQSELELKSKENDRLKNENKMLIDQNSQLKVKESLKEKEEGSNLLEYNTEVQCMLL